MTGWVIVRTDASGRLQIVSTWTEPTREDAELRLEFVLRGIRGDARQRYGLARVVEEVVP